MVLRLPDSWSNWNLEMLVFEERGKPEYPEKNLSEQRREPTTNSTHIWCRHRDLNPDHIIGRGALSPLRHPCSSLQAFFRSHPNPPPSFLFSAHLSLRCPHDLNAWNRLRVHPSGLYPYYLFVTNKYEIAACMINVWSCTEILPKLLLYINWVAKFLQKSIHD